MQRLFVEKPLKLQQEILLEGDQAHYLLHVLRMQVGEEILLFNGSEGEYLAQITAVQKKKIALQCHAQKRAQTAPSSLHYAFAPLKSARLDYMIQKAVEMGVGEITPVLTDFTQLHRLKDERLRANAIEAAEQCGLLNVPHIHGALSFEAFLTHFQETLIFCDEAAPVQEAMAALMGLSGSICVLIGPEGGFSAREREKLLARPKTIRLSLGETILRADTAAVAALALINEARRHIK